VAYLRTNLQTTMKYILTIGVALAAALSARSQLYINEVMASNNTTLANNLGLYQDWIEIYNAGSQPVNLAGYFLSDNEALPMKYEIPFGWTSNTTVPAGGYILFWANSSTDILQPTHTNFSLTADGEPVILSKFEGNSLITVDMVTLPPQQTDISFGRESDGAAEWVFFNNTTPGASNMEIAQTGMILIINEVLTVNTSGIFDDVYEYAPWFEIYNANDVQVNVAGYSVSNGTTTYTIPNTNPVFTTIPANGFQVFFCDGQTNQGPNHMNFTLNGNAGTLTLINPQGQNVPGGSYAYPALSANVSYGRQADGGVTNILFNTPTPRVSNSIVIIPPANLFINELLTANVDNIVDEFDEHDDWFEIYNPNSFPVDLTNYYVSDNMYNPKKDKLTSADPSEITIPAGGWILFWADGQNSQGPRHVKFKLSSVAEELTLRSPDGFSVADHVHWQNLKTDTTYGRLTDGGLPWVHFIETTPEASNNGALVFVTIEEVYQPEVLVYPNPVLDILRLSQKMDVVVYNPEGKQVTKLRQVSEVDFSAYPPGLYYLSNQQGFIARVVKL